MPARMYGNETGEFKVIIVMRLLMNGGIIEHNNHLWAMAEDYRVGCLALNMEKTTADELVPQESENGTYTVIPVLDNGLEEFMYWAEALPEEAIVLSAATVALNDINRRDRS